MGNLNNYEARQQAKKDYYNAKSAEAEQQSQNGFNLVRENGKVIPFGQPILVGHHSERKHRKFIEKQNAAFSKACDLQEKSDYYARKAKAVGKAGISSDDEDAILKLNARLAPLIELQEAMKKVNAVIRKHSGDEEAQIKGILAIGCFTNAQASEVVKPDFAGRVGFPAYALTNNNAKIKNIKKRIAELEAKELLIEVETVCELYTYKEDIGDNRVLFLFNGKPEEAVRDILKRHSFKWSPTRGAWVRMLNNAGLWAAKQVRQQLDVLNA